MSVYTLFGQVLLNSSGLVAIDPACCDCPGACCLPGGDCSVESMADCDLAGGNFYGDPTCDPNPCVTCNGYCCVPSWTPHCGAPVFGEDCVNAGYYFGGCGSTCCGGNTCYCPTHPTGDVIQVVLSGVSTCTTCVNDGFSDSRQWFGSLDGTYNLQKTYSCGEEYHYISTSPVMQEYYYYHNFTCTGTPTIGDLYLELIFQCGSAHANMCLVTPSSPLGGGYSYGCGTQPSPLYSGTSFSLPLSCGGWTNPLGGTATMIVTYSPPEF
jgi:hypothetical protein